MYPVLLDWQIVEQEWRFVTGWPDERSDDPAQMALRIRSNLFGVGRRDQRVRRFGAVPPRVRDHARRRRALRHVLFDLVAEGVPATDRVAPPESLRERVEREFLVTLWDDLEIWRYQKYVEHPALAQQDARPYGSLRKWAKQFYELAP